MRVHQARQDYGIAKVADRLIIMLDLGKVLTGAEQTQLRALPRAA